MADGPRPKTTQEIAALGGPTQLIAQAQTALEATLAGVLERRRAITTRLDEDEIARICASFTAANRGVVRQLVLDAYGYNRYIETPPVIAPDAPESTREIVQTEPEFRR